MSKTLERMMILKQMSAQNQPKMATQFEMDPTQKRNAEADVIMQMAQAMGNPNITGSGIDRTLKALVAGGGPAYHGYGQAEQAAKEENMLKHKFAMEQEKEARREAMDIMRMEREERREARKSIKGETGIGSLKERRILWNSLGNDAKAEEYRKGMILGWSPTKTQENFLRGIHPEEIAEDEGINLAEHEGSYLLTGTGRNQIKQAEGIEAEIESLTNETGKDLKYFSGPSLPGFMGGANIKETFDSLTGKNKEARLRGLGARALQAEIAGARSRFAQSSSAQEALHGMQKDALARVEIFEPNISGEDRVYVQKYMNDKLNKAFKARKRAVMGLKREKEQEHEIDEFEESFSKKSAQRRFKVLDHKTGKEIEMTEDEIRKLQASGELK